jgi:hypothetical protein
MTASRAPVAATNAGCCRPEPWCGTLSTSARRSAPAATTARCDSGSRSPVSSTRTPDVSSIIATLALLATAPSGESPGLTASTRAGQSTDQDTGPAVRRSP